MDREGAREGQQIFTLDGMYYFMYVMLCPSLTPPPPPSPVYIWLLVLLYTLILRSAGEQAVKSIGAVIFPSPHLTLYAVKMTRAR